MEFNISNTKSRIIDTALRMFATEGYDKVSMREIASAVGIKAGSIYAHFESKEQILLECYKFYLEHRHDTRLTKEQYEPIIKNGSKEEIIQALNYSYSDDIIEKMISSLLIMFSRLYIDDRAKDMYADEIKCSLGYLEEFFNTGIEVGRFHEFNVPSVSLIYLSLRLFVAQSVALRPEQKSEWRKAELEMFDELARIIPFK